MYIPPVNELKDQERILAFMQRFSFATIVTNHHHLPVATHLPFLVTKNDNEIILTSHFAKANHQWQDISEQQSLVIFTEPHAYISPSHYEKELNVPTWNYIAVHAYGTGHIISEDEKVMAVLENTIDQYEAAYRKQWDHLPADFKNKMSKGIVAFEIKVTQLQAKHKLSQNKTELEQERIIKTLSGSKDTNERMIGEYMMENKKNV